MWYTCGVCIKLLDVIYKTIAYYIINKIFLNYDINLLYIINPKPLKAKVVTQVKVDYFWDFGFIV